jgi:excisionase family DNA binding protein
MPKISADLVVTIIPAAPSSTSGQDRLTEPQSKLVSSDGTEFPISEATFTVLQQILPTLELGRSTITIAPATAELTTQQAADALNVSRPYLIKLLTEGAIPFVMVGTHRRIRSQDLEAYQTQRNAQRRRSLNELTHLMEEEGLFD